MDDREKDIQKLCKQVIDKSYSWEYDCNGPDIYKCPFCGSYVNDDQDSKKIIHDKDCAVLIARDLSTKIKGG